MSLSSSRKSKMIPSNRNNWKKLTHDSLLSKEDVESSKVFLPSVVCGLSVLHSKVDYTALLTWQFLYLRWQLDEVVKVSPSFGALNILDIVWKAGIVGLVVDFLNLEREWVKIVQGAYITCSSQCFGDGPVSRVHSGSMLRLRESQDLNIPQMIDFLVWKRGHM